MKILVTSPDAIKNKTTGELFENITDSLDYFLGLDENNIVFVLSMWPKNLIGIPKKYNPTQIEGRHRGSPQLINTIVENAQKNIDSSFTYKDVLILGAKDKDMQQAANSKVLLLTAMYSKSNNPKENIFSKPYGVPFSSPIALKHYFQFFLRLENPWYKILNVSENTSLYALTNSNTYFKSEDIVELNEKFKECLKSGETSYRLPFAVYTLVSLYSPNTAEIFKEVDYFCVYPSSGVQKNTDLSYFSEFMSKSFKISSIDLFIRHTTSKKRSNLSPHERADLRCTDQFDTLIVNPKYVDLIKNKSICVIDDYTTYGSSAETARHLLTVCEVKNIIFLALGKFGREYIKYNYQLEGDVSKPGYTYKEVGEREHIGSDARTNNLAENYFVKTLEHYVR